MTTAATGRVRDPDRKEEILGAAADLLAGKGYHAVSMADIGTEAGITGSGIYRHFDSKAAILVALFERVTDDLLSDQQRIIDREPDLARALDQLIAGQVEFVVGDRAIVRVYHNEINHLPDEDQSRLPPQAAAVPRGVGPRRARAASRSRRRLCTHAGPRCDRRHPVDPLPQRRTARGPAADRSQPVRERRTPTRPG